MAKNEKELAAKNAKSAKKGEIGRSNDNRSWLVLCALCVLCGHFFGGMHWSPFLSVHRHLLSSEEWGTGGHTHTPQRASKPPWFFLSVFRGSYPLILEELFALIAAYRCSSLAKFF
ncbi:MAG: hypothetical protein Q8O00_01350, partial [Holophaga sp.]|nr:hypothetical protein [Holophaga sp.]